MVHERYLDNAVLCFTVLTAEQERSVYNTVKSPVF